MPRRRLRAKVLKELKEINVRRSNDADIRRLFMYADDWDSDLDDLLAIEEEEDNQYLAIEEAVRSERYLFRAKNYRDRSDAFDFSDCLSEKSKRFNDDDFLSHFRVSRSSFCTIADLLAKSDCFWCFPGKRKKASVEKHLLVFLRRLGCEGVEGSRVSLASFFGIGKGTVDLYVERVVDALLELKDKVVIWPKGEKKETLKREIKCNFGFQRCIGIIDGTIIILNDRPLKFGDSYWCRKHCYSLNVQVICDHNARVLYYFGGWPGSVHDNRAWRSSKIFRDGKFYFENGEYLVGDSAYSACRFLVQSFKKLPGTSKLNPEKEWFNSMLGSLRVKSEHCIGMLKGRFPSLRRINIKVKGPKEIKKVMDLFGAAVVLHNLLLDCNDTIPSNWYFETKQEHYWTRDYQGIQDLDTNGDPNFDRRDAVFNSMLEDYYS